MAHTSTDSMLSDPMRPRTIWLFSGQGSQYYQMGLDLYENNALFRAELEKADRIASALLNESLLEIIYRARDDRFEPFDLILHTHPALLMMEYALSRVLLEHGVRADALLGYSLGQLSALVVAGAISLEEGMRIAVKAAEIIHYCAPRGRMLAVLHDAELLDQHPDVFAGCEIAAYNFPGNFVVTGMTEAVSAVQAFLAARDINAIELPVAHPFHSSWMSVIETPLRAVVDQVRFGAPQIPVLSALSGEPINPVAPLQLLEAMGGQVDFAQTVRRLEQSGPCRYIDLGPSGSMATIVKYNLGAGSRSELLSIMTRFGQEAGNLQRLLDKNIDKRGRPCNLNGIQRKLKPT
jgi:acyl transferase domain-containing protein